MRWDHMRLDEPESEAGAAEAGGGTGGGTLFDRGAVARTFDTPGFRGMTFYEVHAKSIVNRVPASSRMAFTWTINPYRGCQHACRYCLSPDTPILMADGRTKPLAHVRVGDRIYGTVRDGWYRRYTITTVLAHWSTVKPAYRITLADGTRLIASGDHRFLTERGWKHVTGAEQGPLRRPFLTVDNKLMGTGGFAEPPKDTIDYRRGYLCGTIKPLIAWPESPTPEWRKGFLAGIFDAEGSYSRGVFRIASTDPEIINHTAAALAAFSFGYEAEQTEGRNGLVYLRLRGGLREALRFFHTTDPAIMRKRSIDGAALPSDAKLQIAEIKPLGFEMPMYDITTGTGDFIANGVVSHNCFARNTHTYLDLDAGHDFDSKVVVKVNAPELLRKTLASSRWTGEHIAMGTNVDPYQRAEGKYELMRGIITQLRDRANPFSILTKGTLILRDLDLLTEAAAVTDVGLNFSAAFVDKELWRTLEPGTPSPERRLDACATLTRAGLRCGVLMGPIIPFLSDSPAQLEAAVRRIADSGAAQVTPIILHLRPGTREWYLQWLNDHHPELVRRYLRFYGRGAYAPKAYQAEISGQVRELAQRFGVGATTPVAGRRIGPPTDEAPAPRPGPEQLQLSLL